MADVGYKKPPRHRQFRPGLSGNPRGRPAGVRNLKSDLLDELGEQTTVRENGREQRISKQRAFIRTLVAAAIAGDMRATATLVSFYARSLGGSAEDDGEAPAGADDLEIIENFVARERRRRRTRPAETDPPEQEQTKKDE